MKWLIVLLLFSSFVVAQITDSSVEAIASQQNLNELEPADLAAAIASGEITNFEQISTAQLIEVIRTSPEVATKLDDFALVRALKQDVFLVDNVRVFGTLDRRIKNNVAIANDNPFVKSAWFKQYKISDEGAEVAAYDGVTLTTAGKRGLSFKVKDFPNARVLEDGLLVLGNSRFAGAKSLRYEPVSADEPPVLVLVGGIAEIGVADNGAVGDVRIRVESVQGKPGELRINHGGAQVVYTGNLDYDRGTVRDQVENGENLGFDRVVLLPKSNGRFRAAPIGHRIFGEITEEEAYPAAFRIKTGLIGTAKIDVATVDRDGSFRSIDASFEIQNGKSQDVYYTEAASEGSSAAEDFCIIKPCIVNAVGKNGDPRYKEKLGFYGFDALAKLDVQTLTYYDAVEVDDLQSGKISIANIRKFGKRTYTTTVNVQPGGIVSTKGNLDRFRAGRIDVSYDEEGREMRKHWGSNRNLRSSVRNYFGQWKKSSKLDGEGQQQWYIKPRNSFVTCEDGQTCEREFARNFGKVIPPKGKRKADLGKTWNPTSTVIVAGDISGPARALRKRCEIEGCLVLNSRDVPPGTASSRLVVTGHYAESDAIWRKAPEPLSELSTVRGRMAAYNPIDSVRLESFPKGKVEHVSLESCNSVKKEVTKSGASPEQVVGLDQPYADQLVAAHPTLNVLQRKYDGLQTIQGYDGKTSYHGSVPIAKSLGEMEAYQRARPAIREGKAVTDHRAWYLKGNNNRWYYTINGRTCIDSVSFKQARCQEVVQLVS